MSLVVKLEGVVGVGEVLLGFLLHFFVRGNPVKKFGAVAHVFGVSRLVCLERAVMPLPFFFHCCRAVPAEIFCKIIAAGESYGVCDRPANHNRDTRHVFIQGPFLIGWNYFLVLEVLFQSNAASHNDSELHVVHCTASWIRVKVFFHNFFAAQPMPAARPVRVAASMIVFTSLFSDIVVCRQKPNVHFIFLGSPFSVEQQWEAQAPRAAQVVAAHVVGQPFCRRRP